MAADPHYTQIGGAPAIVGSGFGMLACDCGQSLLIAGYEARNFLDIAIKCAACGRVTETPGVPEGALPPPAVTPVERGAENPPRVASGTVLISREEMRRLATLYQPRPTDSDLHDFSDAMLDDVEYQQWRFTGASLSPSPAGYKSAPLDWAVAHLRWRLRDPEWTTFADANDMAAATVITAFRDLFAGWVHHPLFVAMANTAATERFSLHALAWFGAAKALALAGNQIVFVPAESPRPDIAAIRIARGPDAFLSVAVDRFDRFEWPDGAPATPASIRAEVTETIAAAQGRINRLRPGILVLSGGASDANFDRVVVDSIVAAIDQHGRRNRGLAAVAAIFPKIGLTETPRQAKFGYAFYPVPNRAHAIGQSMRIGSRADHSGFG